MPSRRTLLLIYLTLLLLSSVARWLPERGGDLLEDDFISAGWSHPQGVLVLPDGADDQDRYRPLAAALGDSFHVEVWDPRVRIHKHLYTYQEQGAEVLATLEQNQWRAVDLVAFGTSGGTALDLAARAPDRIRSVTLIDASGVEEFDLLGEHNLNRVLRSGELGLLWTLRNLVPHFGALDRWNFSGQDARILLHNDRRELRQVIPAWKGPTLIINRAHDPSRPMATAKEHARLIPQADLTTYDGALANGMIPTPFLSGALHPFLSSVWQGTAPTRAAATPARIAAAALPFDAGGLASAQGVSLFVVLALLALTTLLSEDVACVAAGVLAARGSIPLWPGIAACYVGIVAGDQLLYLLGRSAGRALVTRVPFRWLLPADRLERACEWFQSHGMKVVLTSRFLPGTRSTVYVAAGILRAGFVRFAIYLLVIGAVWTPALVGLSYVATLRGRGLIESLPGPTWPWALAAVIGGILAFRSILTAASPEGRAGLLSRWRGAKKGK